MENSSKKNQDFQLFGLSIILYLTSPFLALPSTLASMFRPTKWAPTLYALLIAFVSFLYKPPIAWDKARYMEFYRLSKMLDFRGFLEVNFAAQFDFIFRLFVFWASKLNINIHYIFFIATFITVYNIFHVYYKEINKLKLSQLYVSVSVVLFILSLSYIDIISGIRYALAISWIFLGYYKGVFEGKKVAWLYLFLGIFTHFSVTIFAVLYLLFPLFIKIRLQWLKVLLLLSLSFIIIPEKTLLGFFSSIGLGSSIDTKINAYLDKSVLTSEETFAKKIIDFFNVSWVIVLNIYLILKKSKLQTNYIKITTMILIATNVFVSFPIVYNRYNLFLKLFVVIMLMNEEIRLSKLRVPLVFLALFFVVWLNQLIVMRYVLADIFGFGIAKWSFIYQIFENNFQLEDLK